MSVGVHDQGGADSLLRLPPEAVSKPWHLHPDFIIIRRSLLDIPSMIGTAQGIEPIPGRLGRPTMFQLFGPATRLCDGITRRELMRIGGLSLFGGASLPRLLHAAEQRPARSRGPARSVILFNLLG